MAGVNIFRRLTDEDYLALQNEREALRARQRQQDIEQLSSIFAVEGLVWPEEGNADPLANFGVPDSFSQVARSETVRLLFGMVMREESQDTLDRIKPHLALNKAETEDNSIAMSALIKAFKAMPLTSDYQRYMASRDEVFVQRLIDDVQTREAHANWMNLSEGTRQSLIQHVASIQDGIYSHETLQFQAKPILFEACPNIMDKGNAGIDRTFINTATNSENCLYWDEFGSSLETIIHEIRHQHGFQMIEALQKGALDETSPFYQQAIVFRDLMHPQSIYIYPGSKRTDDAIINVSPVPPTSVTAYQVHPYERDAFGTLTVACRVCDALSEASFGSSKVPALLKTSPAVGPRISLIT